MSLIVVEKHVNVKDEVDDDSDEDEKFNPSNEPETSNHFPAFSHLDPKHIEFSDLFPEYPPTDKDGFATVVELDPEVAQKLAGDTKMGSEMVQTLQYSRDNKGGGGWRLKKNIQFFANPSETSSRPRQSDSDDSDSDDDSNGKVPMWHCVGNALGLKFANSSK